LESVAVVRRRLGPLSGVVGVVWSLR